jgi:hypothetical protein
MRPHRVPRILLLTVATLASACREPPTDYRGSGLQVATLPLNDRVGVYRAALGGSFRLEDPTLFILADTTLLPRDAGMAGGTPLQAELLGALRSAGIVKGICKVPERRQREPLICPADRAGYAVRFSEPFARGGDSVQVHIVVEQYATPFGPRAERLRFERAYHIARSGSRWRAVREGRLPQP